MAYKNEQCSPATGRETWFLFSVWDMSWGIQNPCFTMFSLVIFCKRPVINVILFTLKIAVHKIQD